MTRQHASPPVVDVPRRWPLWVFRACISVTALVLFNQAVFAGQFLAGSYSSLAAHQTNAFAANAAMVVSTLAALLLGWRGRGPWWPAAACAVLAVLIIIQVMLGFSRSLALHIPVGVTLIVAAALLAVWAWRWRPAAASHDQLEAPPLAATPGHPLEGHGSPR